MNNLIEPISIGLLIAFAIAVPSCQQATANNGKSFASINHNGYDKPLSKKYSDLPSRKPLAFFVPNICNASQAMQMDSTADLYLSACQKHGGNTVYDGLTLQNKRALGQICKAVSILTESKTRHPISTVCNAVYSVTLTQNNIGISHHD